MTPPLAVVGSSGRRSRLRKRSSFATYGPGETLQPACGCGGGQVDDCKDECSRRGARACDELGQNGYQVCADEWDTDTCLEWGPVNQCAADQTCSEGICQGGMPACQDECEAGELRCAAATDNGVEMCGDFDDDDCLEWGGYEPCTQGDCAAGACPGECTDECQPEGEKTCQGDGYVVCGDQDADQCLEWSDVQDCGEHQTCEKHGRCCIEADEDCEDYDEFSSPPLPCRVGSGRPVKSTPLGQPSSLSTM